MKSCLISLLSLSATLTLSSAANTDFASDSDNQQDSIWAGMADLQEDQPSASFPNSASNISPSSSSFSGIDDNLMSQGAAEEAAQEATIGTEDSTDFMPDREGGGDANMIAGLGDAFDDMPEREGQGFMKSSAAPEGTRGRFLDFWRLRATNMEELITPKGYPAERHKTLTRDGFLLTNFRIPYGRDGPSGVSKPGRGAERMPVLLIHGISLSSTCWVINEPDESLAFILADEGYDVWMMNTRGNTFSREHEKYSDSNPRFWKFSVDEMAQADLPATLTYIQRVTGADKVHVVGHSQGGTLGLAHLAEMPDEADEKISCLIAMAPVVYAKYLLSPTLVAFSYQANVSVASTLAPQEYLFMSGPMQVVFLSGLCQIPAVVPICTASTESMFGGSKFITSAQYQKYWRVWPSPTSYYNALHWGQIFNEGKQSGKPSFFQFNYGDKYDLTAIKTPVVLMTAGRDVLATPKDMARVRSKLAQGGSLSGVHSTEEFGHMDYIWHTGASGLIYSRVLDALDRYTSEAR